MAPAQTRAQALRPPIHRSEDSLGIAVPISSGFMCNSEDRGELAVKAIRDLITGRKLSYDHTFAVQEIPAIRSGSYRQMVIRR